MDFLVICENDMLRNRNSGLKMGVSRAAHTQYQLVSIVIERSKFLLKSYLVFVHVFCSQVANVSVHCSVIFPLSFSFFLHPECCEDNEWQKKEVAYKKRSSSPWSWPPIALLSSALDIGPTKRTMQHLLYTFSDQRLD